MIQNNSLKDLLILYLFQCALFKAKDCIFSLSVKLQTTSTSNYFKAEHA